MNEKEVESTMTVTEPETWLTFKNFVHDFLGYFKRLYFKNIVETFLDTYRKLRCNLSTKLYFLESYLDFSLKTMVILLKMRKNDFIPRSMECEYDGLLLKLEKQYIKKVFLCVM